MPRELKVNSLISIPLDEFRFTFVRSSGPGGQNVNKVNSKALLRWSPAASAGLPTDVRQRFIDTYKHQICHGGELVLTSQRYRDQRRNRDDCLGKVRAMVASVAAAPAVRKPTRPPRAAHERRLQEKRERSSKKTRRRFQPSLAE